MSDRPSIHMTDHALLRWLERAGLLDVASLRAAIEGALDRAFQAGEKIGVANYLIIAHGYVYVVRNGRVTTVVPQSSHYQHLLEDQEQR